jgi:hypothetical protein
VCSPALIVACATRILTAEGGATLSKARAAMARQIDAVKMTIQSVRVPCQQRCAASACQLYTRMWRTAPTIGN